MNNKKILLIDDDPVLGSILLISLQKEGYTVHYQNTLSGLQETLITFAPNVIILDVEIGNQNGIDALPAIKNIIGGTPVIFISSHTQSDFISCAIREGGSVYLKKPFDTEELLAYIEKFLQNSVIETNIIKFGMWSLLPDTHTLILNTNDKTAPIKLTKKEYKLLELLVLNRKRVVLRAEIIAELYNQNIDNTIEMSINNFISKLRKYLSAHKSVQLRTVHGVGYKIVII
ncbi:MAG: response regulator transcription factor [Rikenellaceae bacterium]